MALGVIRAVTERGVRVPDDVSVVGFDDIPEAAYFRPSLTTVSVDIEIATRTNAQVLPGRSVHDLLSGQPWVLGIKDGRAARRPVRVGLRGNSHIEILEGMTDDEVAIPSNSGVLSGQRVRAVLP